MVMNAAVQVRSMVWVGIRVGGELDSRTRGKMKWGVQSLCLLPVWKR